MSFHCWKCRNKPYLVIGCSVGSLKWRLHCAAGEYNSLRDSKRGANEIPRERVNGSDTSTPDSYSCFFFQ